MRSRIAAVSLLERLRLMSAQAEAERGYLDQRIAAAGTRRVEVEAAVLALREREAERQAVLSRVLQLAYRQSRTSTIEILLRTGSVVDAVRHTQALSAVAGQEQSLLTEIRGLAAEQSRLRDTAIALEAELRSLSATLVVKNGAIAKLIERATRLQDAATNGRDVSRVEVEVLKELTAEIARSREESESLMAEVARRTGVPLPRIDRTVWPVRGIVTQEFGPTALALEPPATYKGVAYARFHDALDIAAPLGTPVLAMARGRVAFVGHLSGGAMVVIVAHEGGLVTLYGHLDDTALRPTVRAGDEVQPGDHLGAVGLTGLTTGPHLHFSVRRAGEPADPRSILPPR